MLNSIVERHRRLNPLTETEINIIRSATKLFLQNGYTQTTFKMIEADSGVKVGAITYHFHSKEQMLQLLIEELMYYHTDVLDSMNKEMKNNLLSYAMEVTVQIALCENNREAWDLYNAGYSHPVTFDHIKRWAAEKNYMLFKERLPEWTERDFRDVEIVASGIEFAALKTACDRNFPLDRKVEIVLDSLLKLYNVPKAQREEVIEKILGMDYQNIALDMFEKFVKRLD